MEISVGSLWYVEDTVYDKRVVKIVKIKGTNVEVSRISTTKLPLERVDTTQPLICRLILGVETRSKNKFKIECLSSKFPFHISGPRKENDRMSVPYKPWRESSAYVFAEGYELGTYV